MSTVHASATATTPTTNTVRTGREKGTQIACSDCGRRNDCNCLSELRLLDLIAPLARQLVEHNLAECSFIDIEVVERLALLLDRNDQREREVAAQWADENDREARDLIDDVVNTWGREPDFRRDVAGIAQLRRVPVERVKALV